jgi:hypothetical protein
VVNLKLDVDVMLELPVYTLSSDLCIYYLILMIIR